MTYPQLMINLDLIDQNDRIDFIKENLAYNDRYCKNILTICDDGDFHLFNEDGNEIDISCIDALIAGWINYPGTKKLNILDTIKHIKNFAFENFDELTSVTIPDSVTSIGSYAFGYCSRLKEVIFKGKTKKKVKSMYAYPFGIDDESIIKCI